MLNHMNDIKNVKMVVNKNTYFIDISYGIIQKRKRVSFLGEKYEVKNHVIHTHMKLNQLSSLLFYITKIEDIDSHFEVLEEKKVRNGDKLIIFPRVVLNDHSSCEREVTTLKNMYKSDKYFIRLHQLVFHDYVKKVNRTSADLYEEYIDHNKKLINDFLVDLFKHSAAIHLWELWEQAVNTENNEKQLENIQADLIHDMAECVAEVKKMEQEQNQLDDQTGDALAEIDHYAADVIESQRKAIRELMMNQE